MAIIFDPSPDELPNAIAVVNPAADFAIVNLASPMTELAPIKTSQSA